MAISVGQGLFTGFTFNHDDGSVVLRSQQLSAISHPLRYSDDRKVIFQSLPNSWIWIPEHGWKYHKNPFSFEAHSVSKAFQLSIDSYGAISYLEITGQKYVSA